MLAWLNTILMQVDYSAEAHVDGKDFLGTVVAYRPLKAGAGGDFSFWQLRLVVDGSEGFNMYCASHELEHNGLPLRHEKGLSVTSALYVNGAVLKKLVA